MEMNDWPIGQLTGNFEVSISVPAWPTLPSRGGLRQKFAAAAKVTGHSQNYSYLTIPAD